MTRPVVSIVRHTDTYDSVKKALDLCRGLQGLNKGDKILIKPNLVSWDFELPFPPYGVVTTSAVISALVRILHEEGYRNIAIGEASLGVMGSLAKRIFEVLGYQRLSQKYGVELIDFNEGKFEPVDFGGFRLSIARRALEADKIINLPVLKTHNQCKVSLGIKNFKGCLDRGSKIRCHGRDQELDHLFPRVAEKLPVALTIIDGVFTLARGPGITGQAFRQDILVASRDILACDLVGAALIGYEAAEVEHLSFFARRSSRSTGLEEIELAGEDLAQHKTSIPYDTDWLPDDTGPLAFKKRGITGLALRKYDNSLCTACSKLYSPMLVLIMSAFKGDPFPGVEVLTGKRQLASPGFEKTLLFSRCACQRNKNNPNIKKSIEVQGCPPDLKEFQRLLAGEGIQCDYGQYVSFRHRLFGRYQDKEGFDPGLFNVGWEENGS